MTRRIPALIAIPRADYADPGEWWAVRHALARLSHARAEAMSASALRRHYPAGYLAKRIVPAARAEYTATNSRTCALSALLMLVQARELP